MAAGTPFGGGVQHCHGADEGKHSGGDAGVLRPRETVTLPEPRTLGDYVTAPCKHECGILKQIRHAKQAHRLLSSLNPTRQSLLRATAGKCGLDSAHCHSSTVQEVVSLDRPEGGEGGSREASLFCAATLHRFGLPVDYARLKNETLPESCACFYAPLWDSVIPRTTMDKLFAWQCHLERRGRDGRRLHAHDVVKGPSWILCSRIHLQGALHSHLLVF